jgi:hypothetical protein
MAHALKQLLVAATDLNVSLTAELVIPDDFDSPLPPEMQRYFDGDADET